MTVGSWDINVPGVIEVAHLGYDANVSGRGSISDIDFEIGGTTYAVEVINLETNRIANTTQFIIRFDKALPDGANTDLTLHLGSTSYALNGMTYDESNFKYSNAGTGLSWSQGDTVAVRLTEQPVDTPDNTAPTLQSATVDGAYLTLAFNRALDRTSTPDGSAFMVMIGGTAPTIGTVSIPRGGHGRVRIPLNPAAMAGQTVTVGYTAPGTNPLQSEAGVAVADFSDYAVTNETLPDTPGAGITLVDAEGRRLAGTPPRLTVPEGGSAQFGFQFHTKPRHVVQVGFSHGAGDTDLKSGSSTVWTITVMPDDWVRPHLVTVNALQDTDTVDGERTFETFANSAEEPGRGGWRGAERLVPGGAARCARSDGDRVHAVRQCRRRRRVGAHRQRGGSRTTAVP